MEPRRLPEFGHGTTVRIHSFDAGQAARGRLCALGLTPGTTVVVESCGGLGPCRLKVRGADLVLGHGLANQVLASAVA